MPVGITCEVGDWARAGRREARCGVGGECVEILTQEVEVEGGLEFDSGVGVLT